MKILYRPTLLFLLGLHLAASLSPQSVVRGRVTDKVSGLPVEVATVQLLQGARLVDYTFTDGTGLFRLPAVKQTDSLAVLISVLGYKAQKMRVYIGTDLQITLEPEVFNLKEVEVHPGRVWGRQDTINYDIIQFLNSKDRSIKDVLKRLPGIDIDDLGKISYNGKDISHLYVEGLDLTNGRYSQINNNLRADAVQSVQVMENHQPIRILQKKLKSEAVALNLKLKPEFRNRWMFHLEGGIGVSPFLGKGAVDALQVRRNSQSAYLYKGNNTGDDVTEEQAVLANPASGRLAEPDLPFFLSQPSFTAPLKKERFLFNNAHTLSGNRLYKLEETTQLRLNAGYTHDLQKQKRGSETSYYQANDTVHLIEQSASRIDSDAVQLSLNLEKNAQDRYLTNLLTASGNWVSGLSQFTGTQSAIQQIKTPDFGACNSFRNLWNTNRYTFEARSLLRYHHLPAQLTINGGQQSFPLQQFYTDHSFSLLRKVNDLTQQYTAGATGEVSNLKNGYSLYFTSAYQWNTTQWNASLSLPFVWTTFPEERFSRATLNPSFSLFYKLNYAWRFSASGNYREQYGNTTDFYAEPYQTDYRTRIWNCGVLSVRCRQLYSVYGEYKNTVQEFFITLTLAYNRDGSNLIDEPLFDDGEVTKATRPLANIRDGWSLHGTFSKGFSDWRVKASLSWLLSRSEAEELSEGKRMPYLYRFIQYEPKLIWSPVSDLEVSYQADIRYEASRIGCDTELDPLLNVVQKLCLSYELSSFEANLFADHYSNDVSRDKSVHTFFLDASVCWKSGKWRMECRTNNLFNRKQYGYTRYSSLESFTSWIQIRGRELLGSVSYTF